MGKQKNALETEFLDFAKDNRYSFTPEEVNETRPGSLDVIMDRANAKAHSLFRETLKRGGWTIGKVFVKQTDGIDSVTLVYRISAYAS